ncbi:Ig-like domain-containing protein [Dyella choica]|uniref:Uncharacterized protein n=1 Tax=Dyella choica TaxID=1927959 RepID=A0A3S0RH25_9GAMM|nr:Ig-like domain-containing protein [Dyella choica]RUL68507.1 hypothetical protein EKH80_23475 [Dyella choica]
MFIFSQPNAPSQSDTVIVAQASQVNHGARREHILGICQAIPSFQKTPPTINEQGEYVLSFPAAGSDYFQMYENKVLPDTGTATVQSQPKHGILEDDGGGNYTYLPNPGYLGEDGATFLVDLNSQKVKVIYFFHVIEGHADMNSDRFQSLCKDGGMWQISALSASKKQIRR